MVLISNNSIDGRVESFAKLCGYPYIDKANKPFQKVYRTNKYLKKYQNDQIVFVGDKIVTDIIGAKKNKSFAILVDPLYPKSTHWYTYVMNFSEFVFNKIINFKRGEYYDDM